MCRASRFLCISSNSRGVVPPDSPLDAHPVIQRGLKSLRGSLGPLLATLSTDPQGLGDTAQQAIELLPQGGSDNLTEHCLCLPRLFHRCPPIQALPEKYLHYCHCQLYRAQAHGGEATCRYQKGGARLEREGVFQTADLLVQSLAMHMVP